MSLIDKLTKE